MGGHYLLYTFHETMPGIVLVLANGVVDTD